MFPRSCRVDGHHPRRDPTIFDRFLFHGSGRGSGRSLIFHSFDTHVESSLWAKFQDRPTFGGRDMSVSLRQTDRQTDRRYDLLMSSESLLCTGVRRALEGITVLIHV